MTKIRLELIITVVISLLIGISIGITAIHLLTPATPGIEGQWRQYMRF